MAEMLLTIEHAGTVFTPPVKDEIKVERERNGAPSKLTFTTVKVDGMDFTEGDAVCFYYDNKSIFMGYVFTKKRDKKQQIEVTCYDQMRYLKNKYTYVFEKKTATQIIQALCKDYNLHTGKLANTNYVIPSVVEENISAIDIALNTLDETLVNTGKMFTLYDDFGDLTLKNVEDMVSETLVFKDTAENFDYSSSIDNETYNSIVLYYKPKTATTTSSASTTSSSDAAKVIKVASGEIGTKETGLNNVKYNTAYYGKTSSLPWCCVFVWWVFREAGLSNLFYDGGKTASCGQLMKWFKNKGAFYTSNPQPGDLVFFKFNSDTTTADHVGIVESVKSDGSVGTIEGNCSNAVKRMNRKEGIVGYGRPAYSTSGKARSSSSSSSSSSGSSSSSSSSSTAIRVFSSSDNTKIGEWGTLRYFEEIKDPNIGQTKARQLLELYCRKRRELKINGQVGDTTVRGGTLIPVILNLGDATVNNYMLVDKVTHVFKNDRHTMDLTLEGAWKEDDISKDSISQYASPTPSVEKSPSNVGTNATNGTFGQGFGGGYSSGTTSSGGARPTGGGSKSDGLHSGGSVEKTSGAGFTGGWDDHPGLLVCILGGEQYAGVATIKYVDTNKNQKTKTLSKGMLKVDVYYGTTITIDVEPARGHSYKIEGFSVNKGRVRPNTYKFTADGDKNAWLRWVK